MKQILQRDAPVLREIAKEVPLDKIGTPAIRKVLAEMKEALASQDDGVALAAPQIGYPMRIFVVSGKIDDLSDDSAPDPDTAEENAPSHGPDLVFINPVIKKTSKQKKLVEEGCLSVRYLYGKVNRYVKATIEAYDENGKKFERGAKGLLAQIFQHETDHLNGILFIDKARDVEDLPPAPIRSEAKTKAKKTHA
jgi:peptide deformylase